MLMSLTLRRVAAVAALAMAMATATTATAQSAPPPLPPMTAAQSDEVRQTLEAYRLDTEARVARGEITPDEAGRLIAWREWQVAQAATDQAPPAYAPPQTIPPPPVTWAAPYPYYAAPSYYAPPYYAPPYPYYGTPAPVYWGFSVCTGRGYRHGWASICI
jgi:hypothetical protein